MARSPRTRWAKQEVQLADLIVQARDLRCRGLSYEAIGKIQGCGKRTAWRRVHRALAKPLDDSAEETRRFELARLDKMFAGLVKAGAFEGDPSAVAAAVKILDRRAKYLGLDAPAKHEVNAHIDGRITPEDAARIMRETFRNDMGPEPPKEPTSPKDDGTSGDEP